MEKIKYLYQKPTEPGIYLVQLNKNSTVLFIAEIGIIKNELTILSSNFNASQNIPLTEEWCKGIGFHKISNFFSERKNAV